MTTQTTPLVQISGLQFRYGSRQLLRDVDLNIDPGASAAIVGRTGSGKSTLLGCLAGMLRPHAGAITIAGQDVTAMRHRQLAAYRRRTLGFVFQFGELLPTLTARENVALPALFDDTPWHDASTRAAKLLAQLEVQDTDAPASTLSGGERQRVALARALINDPPVLIADEPTGSLDADTRDDVMRLLLTRPGHEHSALLIVTHDPAIAAAAADTVHTLDDGSLIAMCRAAR